MEEWVQKNLEKVTEGPGYEVYISVNGGDPWIRVLKDSDLGDTKSGKFRRVIQTSWEMFRAGGTEFRHSISIWRRK